MPRYCHNPPLGTTPNATIRIQTNIRTPYAAAPCGSAAEITRKHVEKMRPTRPWRVSGRFFAYFGTRYVSASVLAALSASIPQTHKEPL